MEKEAAGRRRMEKIAAHFAPSCQDLSSATHLLPMKCSGSLNSRIPRCDNRLYFARQDSASLPFFMRPQCLSTPPHNHHQQQQPQGNCTALAEAVLPEPPLFSRPRRSVEPINDPPNSQSNTVTETLPPKFARPQLGPTGHERLPRMDVAESGRTYIVTLQLPGVNANDITVQLHPTSLRILGKPGIRSQSMCSYGRKTDITQEPYQVSWPLPSDANTDAITADFFDGILQVIVPKL